MDVGSLLGAITGKPAVQLEIRLDTPDTMGGIDPKTNSSVEKPASMLIPMDHYPSWKLHKNPFWRVKHPLGKQLLQTAPLPPPQSPHLQAPYSSGMTNYNINSPYDPQQQQPFQLQGRNMSSMSRDLVFAYEASQDISGVVILRIPATGKKVEHLGIKCMLIGRIDMSMGIHEGKAHYDFISISKELSPPGMLFHAETVLPFRFRHTDKEFESYRGRNVSVRYFIRAIMERKFLLPLKKEHDLWVQVLGQEPKEHEPIKMEVGIEDCLHIEFEYERRMYHLQDTILGKIHFLLVRIKIKHMELAVIRRETSGEGVAAAAAAAEAGAANSTAAVDSNTNIYTETQTLVKYEIMDGAPVKDEVIPVKLSLKGIPADLTPTYTAVNNRFSVRYFLNLVLVDEDDRRYFKQQEIILWRKELG